jgi:hypothetical protein
MPQPEEHFSPDGSLTFGVEDLGGGDVAIGFCGFPWHTHADILASMSGRSEDEAVRAYVDTVLDDSAVIAILSVDGVVSDVWITDDPESERQYIEPNENLQFRYWSGRSYGNG